MSPNLTLTAYCVLILAASLVGGWLPLKIRLTHRRLQLLSSVVAGFMLGVGLLHMLPHAQLQLGDIQRTSLWLLAGFLTMFILERFFCFHHHDVEEAADPHHDHQAADEHHHHHHLTWTGTAVGLTLHSLLDGAAVAAAVELEAGSRHAALAGLAVFLVVFLHRPFDAMALGTLMAAGGHSLRFRHVINGLFALAIPAGALLFHLGFARLFHQHEPIGIALAFSAGMFLCIASSDLLPELQFHQHDRGKLTAALFLGLALAAAISYVESRSEAHEHHHGPAGHVEHEH